MPSFFVLQAAIPVVSVVMLAVLVATVHRVAWLAPLWQYLGEYEPLSRQRLFNAAAVPRQGLFVSLYVVLPVLLIGVPTLMMGLSFAYLQRAVQTDLAALGRRIGWLQTANIAGSMLGAMVTGILLLDWFGTTGTLRLLALCSLVFLGLLARTASSRRMAIPAMISAAAVLGLAAALPSATTFWARLHGAHPNEVLQAEDGSGLSVLKRQPREGRTIVHANGLGQSSLPWGGVHTILGALPAMVHPHPQTVAVIGLGSGDTVYAAGGRASIRHIDSIEIIEPEIETLSRLDQSIRYPGLSELLGDRRVQHWFTDGRAFLKKERRRYDIVEADALRPSSAYAGNLYSVEYFALLRDALEPGGLAVSWAPTARVVDTFVSVFPHVLLFGDVVMGSATPIAYDAVAVQSRLNESFSRDYFYGGGVDLDALLGDMVRRGPTQVYRPDFDRTQLVDLNRDLFPKDEFGVSYLGRRAVAAASTAAATGARAKSD